MQDRPRRSPPRCAQLHCDPSKRQAHRRYVSFHCTGEETHCSRFCIEQAEKQRQVFEEELAQAEKDLERFRREAETAQAGRSGPCRQEFTSPRGGVDPDVPSGPSVKRPCRTGEVRGIGGTTTLFSRETALELTAKLSDGVEQMVEMTDGMRP